MTSPKTNPIRVVNAAVNRLDDAIPKVTFGFWDSLFLFKCLLLYFRNTSTQSSSASLLNGAT